MEKHVKNQHYVPQFLLKHFSSDGNLIWCYDKKWMVSGERNVSRVASENYFYDLHPGQKEGSLEYDLASIESDVAPIIMKIVKARSLQAVCYNEKKILSYFIALQLCRTKSFLKNTELSHKKFYDFFSEFLTAAGEVHNLKHQDSKQLWFSMFEAVAEFSEILLKKLWFLIESNNAFYSSDGPVVLQNIYNNATNRGTLGLNSDGIEIYFPITPSLLICLFCERIYGSIKEHRFECSEQNIVNINSLQVAYSERFVFSAQNNFGLVVEMINGK